MQPSPVEDSRDSMPSYPEPSAALLLLAIAMGAYRGAFVHADRHVASYYDFDHTHSQVSQSHQERGAIQPPPVEVDGNGTPPCPEPSGPDDTISTDSSYEPHVEPLTPATEVTIAEQENVRAQDVALDIGVAGVPDGPPATTSPPPLGTPPSVLIPPEPSTSDGTGPIDYPVEPCVEPLTPRTEVTSMDEEAIGVRNVTQEEAVGVSVGPQPTRSPPPQDRPLSVLEPSVRSTPPPSLRPPKSVRHGVKKDRRDRSRRDRAKNPAFVRKGDNL